MNDLPAPCRLIRSRLVAAFVLLIVGFGATKMAPLHAQQTAPPTQAELDAAILEGLKVDKTLPTPGALIGRPPKSGPRVISADSVDGVSQKSVSATGNVSLKQGNLTLGAERLEYDRETDTAVAPGRITLNRDGDVVSGRDLKLKVEDEIGSLDDPSFFFSKSPTRPSQRYEARGAATRMNFEGADQERLFDAFYTTCKSDESEWYLRISELSLDRVRNIGTGYNAVVEFKGVPILYMPYLTFPLNNARKSGFLPPTFGTSSNSGIEVAVPYYWNLAPNRDATVTPKIYSRRGLQIGAEFRYLDRGYLGQLDTEYLPNDRVADRDRYLASLRHYQNLDKWLSPGWSASINAQKVSDDNYFRDLSTRISNTAQTNLPRDLALSYASDYGNLTARYLSFQTLQDSTARPIATPYKLAPQLTFNARPNRWKSARQW